MSEARPKIHRQQPVWRDQDALGHVNNAVFLTYVENAREAYWRAFDPGFEIFPFILARVEIDYVSPATWRDSIIIRTWISRFGSSSFDFSHVLLAANDREVARVRSVQVMFDHDAGTKMPIDDALRERFDLFESSEEATG